MSRAWRPHVLCEREGAVEKHQPYSVRKFAGDDERVARVEHLFPSVKDRSKLRLDEEAAYSVSNETSAAKVAQVALSLGAAALGVSTVRRCAILDLVFDTHVGDESRVLWDLCRERCGTPRVNLWPLSARPELSIRGPTRSRERLR